MTQALQIYSRDALIAQVELGNTFSYHLFYGHKESPDGTVTDSCLSQWYPAKFEIDGIVYLTSEQFMMAEKARLFGDDTMLAEILKSNTPKEAKALGRKVSNFDGAIWGRECTKVVVRANVAKFSQNAGFSAYLLSTAPAVIVEASPRDRIWGIGMGKGSPAALDPRTWRGSNLLGFALMQVRDLLS